MNLEQVGHDHRSSTPAAPRASFKLTPRITAAGLCAIVAVVRRAPASALGKALGQQALEFARSKTIEGNAAQVVALLLGDLHRQGWLVEARGDEVWVTPPRTAGEEGEPAAEVKQRLRDALLAFRAEQLKDPAVRAFLKRMEMPRVYEGRRVSVLDLIDDGHALSAALADVAALPPAERTTALDAVIRPTVELANSEAKCATTGLLLLDVWRYFRHTWSLEYRATPGRTLFLLIRNAARPMRPVMAIACLTNAQLQIRVRDRWVGWNATGLLDRLIGGKTSWAEEREALLRTVREARAQIRSDDLLQRAGDADGRDLESRLFAMAEAAARDRTAEQRDRAERARRGEELPPIKRLPVGTDGRVDWLKASEAPLFVRKRAQTLAKILFAERILGAIPDDVPDVVAHLKASEDAMRALAIATREVRKVGLASRLLELNVCGAIPPYRDLLGGKLAALSVASAEVCGWYAARYQDQASEIASQLAGREVVRDASAYVITTTSLYAVSASQYNRLKVAVSTPSGTSEVRWRDLGLTEGFGTTHLGDELFRAMRSYSTTLRGGRNVNNVFGEGQSPRLRQAREALEDLGLESNAILQHSSPRRVYGLELFRGALEALRLNRTARVERPSFAAVAEAWRDRWLVHRICNRDVLRRVAEQGPASVRAELTPPTLQLDLFSTPKSGPPSSSLSPPDPLRGRR
ncbi:Druantia anti-phage system protein DruA [Sorangium sp. So ce1024]|uniref:Druantia anti-phage system protein DruA n=1 Tax=Sorangium sp. So ce1024 TaxID=3133327 RepID=UPI003F0C41A5